MNDSLPDAAVATDSKACLLLVACYDDLAAAIRPVVDNASARVMMSPVLGDFIEPRFIGLGSRPAQPGQRAAAVNQVAVELTFPTSGAAENHFALAVIDRFATTVDRLLADCEADPVVAALAARCHGFAAIDDRRADADLDRRPGETETAPDPTPRIVISANGTWSRRDLAAGLLQYAEHLLDSVAASHEPGVSPDRLAGIRAGDRRSAAARARNLDDDDTELDLRPAPAAETPAEQVIAPAEQAVTPAEQAIAPAVPVSADRAGGEPVRPPPVHHAQVLPVTALVYFCLLGGDSAGQQSDWRRGRSLVLEVDEKIASAAGLSFQVRAFQGAGDTAKGSLRPAGQLCRRDLRRPEPSLDFGQLLTNVLGVMRGDTETLRRSVAMLGDPVVVFFAATAPLADAITAQVYAGLARCGRVVWIAPEHVIRLMSPLFQAPGVRFCGDYEGAGGEVAALLTDRARHR